MIISRTPFRISFLGGGTDYPVWYEKHGGMVLSTTIDKYCYIICRRRPPFFEHKVRVVWSKIELAETTGKIEHPTARETLAFLGLHENIEVHHVADLPAQSGLGASSSFTVGLLNALYALRGEKVAKERLAKEAIYIERDKVGDNVGSQDQTAVAFGGFNKIVFMPDGRTEVGRLDLHPGTVARFQDYLLLFFTGLSRSASAIAGAQIKNTPRKEKELHAMQKMVSDGIALLETEDFRGFGNLLHESWQLKRGLSDLITNPHIDEIYEAARSAGALGGKLLGAGGGGFILIYADPSAHKKIKERLGKLLYVPIRFEEKGSQIIHQSDEGLEG